MRGGTSPAIIARTCSTELNAWASAFSGVNPPRCGVATTPGRRASSGLGRWSAKDVTRVLESGLLPNFDAVGSTMGEVVRATSKLDPADRAAIAAYLATVPPLANPKAPATQPGP